MASTLVEKLMEKFQLEDYEVLKTLKAVNWSMLKPLILYILKKLR